MEVISWELSACSIEPVNNWAGRNCSAWSKLLMCELISWRFIPCAQTMKTSCVYIYRPVDQILANDLSKFVWLLTVWLLYKVLHEITLCKDTSLHLDLYIRWHVASITLNKDIHVASKASQHQQHRCHAMHQKRRVDQFVAHLRQCSKLSGVRIINIHPWMWIFMIFSFIFIVRSCST